MKKIKKLWENNRVLLVLGIIIFICICIIGIVMAKFFFGGNSSSYGDRLTDIESIPYQEDSQNELINSLKENEEVETVTVKTKGKIIYVKIVVKEGTSLDKAKEIANKSLEKIGKEYLEKYDIEYTLQSIKEDGFTIMGAKNINRPSIVWNNNTPVKE